MILLPYQFQFPAQCLYETGLCCINFDLELKSGQCAYSGVTQSFRMGIGFDGQAVERLAVLGMCVGGGCFFPPGVEPLQNMLPSQIAVE